MVQGTPIGAGAGAHATRGAPGESGFAFAFLVFVIASSPFTAADVAAGTSIFIPRGADAFFATGAPFIHIRAGTFFIISSGIIRAGAAGSARGAAVNISPRIAGVSIAFNLIFCAAAAGATAVFDISGGDIAGGIIVPIAGVATFFIFAVAGRALALFVSAGAGLVIFRITGTPRVPIAVIRTFAAGGLSGAAFLIGIALQSASLLIIRFNRPRAARRTPAKVRPRTRAATIPRIRYKTHGGREP